MNGNPWTDEDIRVLRRLYPTTPTEDLAKALRRTAYSVALKAKRLGIVKQRKGKVKQRVGFRPFEEIAAEADIWTQLQRDIEAVARKDAQRALGIRV